MRCVVLRSRRVHLLGFTFRVWLSSLGLLNDSRHVVLCGVASACNLYNSVCSRSDLRLATIERNLCMVCRLRTQYVALDKVTSIENAAAEAQSAADANDSKKLFSIVRRLAGAPARALNTLKDATGKIVSSAADQAVLWRSHFCNVFKASVVSDLYQDPLEGASPDQVVLNPVPFESGIVDPAGLKSCTPVGEEPGDVYVDWSTFEWVQKLHRAGFAPSR